MNNANDDKSPLIDLLTCIVCKVTMKIASSTPESSGSDIIQYRCEQCGRIELVRLIREVEMRQPDAVTRGISIELGVKAKK